MRYSQCHAEQLLCWGCRSELDPPALSLGPGVLTSARAQGPASVGLRARTDPPITRSSPPLPTSSHSNQHLTSQTYRMSDWGDPFTPRPSGSSAGRDSRPPRQRLRVRTAGGLDSDSPLDDDDSPFAPIANSSHSSRISQSGRSSYDAPAGGASPSRATDAHSAPSGGGPSGGERDWPPIVSLDETQRAAEVSKERPGWHLVPVTDEQQLEKDDPAAVKDFRRMQRKGKPLWEWVENVPARTDAQAGEPARAQSIFST